MKIDYTSPDLWVSEPTDAQDRRQGLRLACNILGVSVEPTNAPAEVQLTLLASALLKKRVECAKLYSRAEALQDTIVELRQSKAGA
jgi:hypothetical protein